MVGRSGKVEFSRFLSMWFGWGRKEKSEAGGLELASDRKGDSSVGVCACAGVGSGIHASVWREGPLRVIAVEGGRTIKGQDSPVRAAW